jgi:hypothetical protein
MDARQTFVVYLHEHRIATGTGASRRFAKRFAAINALDVIKADPAIIKRLCTCEQFVDEIGETDSDTDDEFVSQPTG